MKTETNLPTRPANLLSLIPIDLRVWMPASELAAAAREAAETFYWLEADEEEHMPFGGCACPLRKLAVLTYSYAAGTLAHDLIALEMVEDPALRSLTGDAVFAPAMLRLFRAHNSELIKLCLARVIEQAWRLNIGDTAGKRTFFAAEAGRRVELAWRAEAPAAIAMLDDHADEPVVLPTSPVLPRPFLPRFAAAACVLMVVFLWAFKMSAEEVLPKFSFKGRAYTNATVHQSTPVDVLVRDGEQGFVRIPLREMPGELQARFPYDASAAAAYERGKAEQAQAQREQARAATLNTLRRQEADVLARIQSTERQLAALQRQLDVLNVSARGKKNSAARQEADRLREVKRDQIAHVDQLRLQLQGIRERQAQYR